MANISRHYQTPEKSLGSHNDCDENRVCDDSEAARDSSGLVACGWCGRRFRPDGSRKRFCDHDCYAASLRVPIEQRFWSKVNRHGPAPAHIPDLGRCWIFTGKARLREYGSVAGRKNGKPWPQYAHRLAWELTHGPIPEGLSVLHKCDVPLCCNPDHLFLGTQADNVHDAQRKGRLRPGGRKPLVLERVPFRLLPVIGTVHTAEDARVSFAAQLNTTGRVS